MFIGFYCEIVLYFLQDLKCLVICIVNGEYMGCKIGLLIIDLVLCMLYDMIGVDSSVLKCYFMCVKSGVLMKLLMIVICNCEQCVIGLLCINMNFDVLFLQIMNIFILLEMLEVGLVVNFVFLVEDLVIQMLEFMIEEVNVDCNVFNNVKNCQIVFNLYEKGIFDIKDVINQVVDCLNILKYMVYFYICQFKSGDFQGQDK